MKTVKTCDIKFLRGDKVYLRPFEKEDIDTSDYRLWINDPQMIYTEAGSSPHTREDLIAYYEKHINNNTMYFFAVVDIKTRKVVGTARIYDINWLHRIACRGLMIGNKYQGKGFATEALNLLCKFAFEYLNLNKLKSGTYIENKGIVKVNERIGFKKEGLLRQERWTRGEYHDIIIWGLLKKEWKS